MSYAREDSDLATRVRTALKARRINVWWDENLLVADPWQERIESALSSASSVVVLWSQHAVASDWVRHEASFAKLTKKAVFAQLDNAEIPTIFSGLQSAKLDTWDGNYESKEMDRLVSSIKRAHRRRKYSQWRMTIPLFAGLIAIALSILVIAFKQGALDSSAASLAKCEKQLDEAVTRTGTLQTSLNELSNRNKALNQDIASLRRNVEIRDGKLYQKNNDTRIFYPQGHIIHCSGPSCTLYLRSGGPQLESWPY